MVAMKRAREFRGVEARRAEEEAEIVAALQRQNGVSTAEKLAAILWSQGEDLRQELEAANNREAALRAAVLTTIAQRRGAEARAAEADGRALAAEAERDAARTSQAAALRQHGERLQAEVSDLRERLALAEHRTQELLAEARDNVTAVREAERVAREMEVRLTLAEHATTTALERVRVAEAERDAARALQDAADRELAKLRKPRRLTPPDAAPVATVRMERVEGVGQASGVEVRLWVRQTRALLALRDVPAERWERDDAAQLRRQVYRLQQHAPGAARAALSERALELARALGGG